MHIEDVTGDITTLFVDAIVNAANTKLLLGGGVAGAIREKGGPSIQEECDGYIASQGGPIGLGDIRTTGAGDLPCDYIIHAAVISWGTPAIPNVLDRAITNIVVEANRLKVDSLAIPLLGAGVGGLPAEWVRGHIRAKIGMIVTTGLDSVKHCLIVSYDGPEIPSPLGKD
jgi:O-acetyl-ADP-ribose deacetylase (regulator of RNase III)